MYFFTLFYSSHHHVNLESKGHQRWPTFHLRPPRKLVSKILIHQPTYLGAQLQELVLICIYICNTTILKLLVWSILARKIKMEVSDDSFLHRIEPLVWLFSTRFFTTGDGLPGGEKPYIKVSSKLKEVIRRHCEHCELRLREEQKKIAQQRRVFKAQESIMSEDEKKKRRKMRKVSETVLASALSLCTLHLSSNTIF